ncbi:type II toxin-antitoxin system PemK/MazF family toxin, partial [Microcoleus sp. A2-C5]
YWYSAPGASFFYSQYRLDLNREVLGDVVVVPFPFSDLTQAKRRPALVIATLTGDDLILCQITSQRIADRYAITLESSDFSEGRLKPYEQH